VFPTREDELLNPPEVTENMQCLFMVEQSRSNPFKRRYCGKGKKNYYKGFPRASVHWDYIKQEVELLLPG